MMQHEFFRLMWEVDSEDDRKNMYLSVAFPSKFYDLKNRTQNDERRRIGSLNHQSPTTNAQVVSTNTHNYLKTLNVQGI